MVFGFLKRIFSGEEGSDTQKSIQQGLESSFSKIENDIAVIKAWLMHLSKRSIDTDDKHEHHGTEIALSKQDIDGIKQWLHFLYNHINELKKNTGETTDYLEKVDQQYTQVSERLKKIEDEIEEKISKGQVGTSGGTIKGQVMSEKIVDKKLQILTKPKIVKKSGYFVGFDKESLSGAELEVLNLLYHSDRILGYDEMANRLGKKEKSIRNLIYRLRRKGIEVLDKPIGMREKGFFLSKEAKITVSGR